MRPFRVFGPSRGQREPELAVQLAQHARALHQGAAVLVPEIAFPFHRRGGGELADDLLDDILEGHQALQLPYSSTTSAMRWWFSWKYWSCANTGVPAGTK